MEVLMLMVTVVILSLYFIFGKKTKDEKRMTYDLVVRFDELNYFDIHEIECFKEIASWTKYGKYGFRGFSKLNKEELEQYIINNLNISKDKFKVIKANPGLYLPS